MLPLRFCTQNDEKTSKLQNAITRSEARLVRFMPELMILVKGMVVACRSVFFTLLLLLIVTAAWQTLDTCSLLSRYPKRGRKTC